MNSAYRSPPPIIDKQGNITNRRSILRWSYARRFGFRNAAGRKWSTRERRDEFLGLSLLDAQQARDNYRSEQLERRSTGWQTITA